MTPVIKGFLLGLLGGLVVFLLSAMVPFTAPYAPILALIAFGAIWYTVYARSGGAL